MTLYEVYDSVTNEAVKDKKFLFPKRFTSLLEAELFILSVNDPNHIDCPIFRYFYDIRNGNDLEVRPVWVCPTEKEKAVIVNQ